MEGQANIKDTEHLNQILRFASMSVKEMQQEGVHPQTVAFVEKNRPQLERMIAEQPNFVGRIKAGLQQRKMVQHGSHPLAPPTVRSMPPQIPAGVPSAPGMTTSQRPQQMGVNQASVPIAVHLDHATDPEHLELALSLAEQGIAFDSIMVDASHAEVPELAPTTCMT